MPCSKCEKDTPTQSYSELRYLKKGKFTDDNGFSYTSLVPKTYSVELCYPCMVHAIQNDLRDHQTLQVAS